MGKKLSLAGTAVFVLLGLLLLLVKPFAPDLTLLGHQALAGVLFTVGIWIFKPFGLPQSMGAFFLCAYLLIIGLPPATVFSGFTQSAVWTLIPALFFGFVLLDTGLGRRIAMTVLSLFKPSYPTMLLTWLLIGVILSVLTPSMTVRVAIIMPIAVQCVSLYGLPVRSRGGSLVLLTAFAMALLPGTGWLSGSLNGPIIQGMFDGVDALKGMVVFDSWWKVNLLPMEIVSLIMICGGYFVIRPKELLSQEGVANLKEELKTPMTRKEKAAGIILVLVFTGFLTNRFHHIPDAGVCLIAVVAFFVTGVMKTKDFSSGISWDLVVFVATSLGMGQVFAATGISSWLSTVIVPILAPIAGNPWLFTYVMAIGLFLWRFLDIAILIPTMAILVPILPDVQASYGISPMVFVPLFIMAISSMFLSYQNMWALMSEEIAGENRWGTAELFRYGTLYFLACMAALAIAIPVWMAMGLY